MKLTIIKLFTKETMAYSALIVILFSFSEKIIQLIRGIIFARLLGPVEYGVYNLAFFFIPLAVTLAKLGIPSNFARYVPQYEQKHMLQKFINKNYTIVMIGGLAITIMIMIFSKQLTSAVFHSTAYYGLILICGITILPQAMVEALTATFAGLRVFKLDAIIRFTQFIIFTTMGIILVINSPKTAVLLWANLAAYLIAGLVFYWLLKRYLMMMGDQSEKIVEHGFYKKIFKFSIFFMFAPMVNTLYSYTDRWSIGFLLDLEQVGIYSVASNISGLIFAAGMITGNVLMPNLSHAWELGNRAKVMMLFNFAAKTSTLLLFMIALMITLTKDWLIPWMYGEAYSASITVFQYLLLFWIIHSLIWTLGSYAGLIEKTYIPFVASLIGLVINVSLNLLLIPQLGIQGAAIATVCSSIIMVILLIVWYLRAGLALKHQTLLVLAMPLILLINNLWLLAGVGVGLIIVALFTKIVFNLEEKQLIKQSIKGLATSLSGSVRDGA